MKVLKSHYTRTTPKNCVMVNQWYNARQEIEKLKVIYVLLFILNQKRKAYMHFAK